MIFDTRITIFQIFMSSDNVDTATVRARPKVRLPIMQFRNCDCEKRRISPLLRRLCIRTTSLNAQLTLGTNLALRIRIKACCNVERAASSEKLTTETVQKIADIKGRDLTSFRIACKSRGQSTESSMISISNNGRDFNTFEILRVTNTTHFWRSYNKGDHNKPFLRRKPLKTRFAPALRTPSDDSKSKVLLSSKKV